MLARYYPLFWFLLCLTCVACTSSGGDRSGSRTGSGEGGLPEVEEGGDASAGDFRVILFQAREGQTMIMVNRGHSLRRTRQGRERLALNQPLLGYKVLPEQNMRALLSSLRERGFDDLATPFQEADSRFFEAAGPTDRYRGMILVEQNGAMVKVLGMRPDGPDDALGRQRFEAFIDLKKVCLVWFTGQSETEVPASGHLIRPNG